MTTQMRRAPKTWQRRAAVAAFVLVATAYLGSIIVFAQVAPWQWSDWAGALGYTFWVSAFAIVGLIVAFHRPGNLIAWICLAFSAVWAVWILLDSLLQYESTHPGSLDRPDLIAAVAHPLWVPGVGLIGFLLLLFPDGHLPSPRWRAVAWLLGVTMTILTLTSLFLPGLVQDTAYVNPLGNEALEPFDQGAAGLVLVLLLIASLLASAWSLVVRYRSAADNERLQLKWLMAAGVVAALAYALLFIWGDFTVQLVWALIPIAIGLSMHRHRLYDIDRLISRTLLYAVVVGVLGIVFAGAVFLLQWLLPSGEQVAVAGSTLAAAALFNPVRRRAQNRIDRHFNRSRFDAQRVAEGFASGLRDATDAERIVQGWIDVVTQTLEPTRVGIWVRSPELPSPSNPVSSIPS